MKEVEVQAGEGVGLGNGQGVEIGVTDSVASFDEGVTMVGDVGISRDGEKEEQPAKQVDAARTITIRLFSHLKYWMFAISISYGVATANAIH